LKQAWEEESDKSQEFDDWVWIHFWWPLTNASQRHGSKYAPPSAETLKVLDGIYENAYATVVSYMFEE
jgi:hypothetical protein